MRDGATRYVANADVPVYALSNGDWALPVTVGDGNLETCYVAGPYAHYITYAREEVHMLGQPVLEGLLTPLIGGIGLALRAGEVNRVAIADNWLVSTNLHPAGLTPSVLRDLRDVLVTAFPTHAIAMRSVAAVPNADLVRAFADAGWLAIPSRQVWFQTPGEGLSRDARKAWKKDFRLLDTGEYEVVDQFAEADYPRLRELYDQLYLGKYTDHNPHFTVELLKLGVLRIQALRHRETGRLDGVMGCFWRNGLLTTPVFGYDLTLPPTAGLYRMLSALVYREAEKRGVVAHQSSGAAGFKRSRGAQPAIEYTMVNTQHLLPHRQAAWSLLAAAMNGIGAPLMQALRT